MKAKELKKIIAELGADGKGRIARSLKVSVRIVDYWLTGDVKIRAVNATAIMSLLASHRKAHGCFVVPLKKK